MTHSSIQPGGCYHGSFPPRQNGKLPREPRSFLPLVIVVLAIILVFFAVARH